MNRSIAGAAGFLLAIAIPASVCAESGKISLRYEGQSLSDVASDLAARCGRNIVLKVADDDEALFLSRDDIACDAAFELLAAEAHLLLRMPSEGSNLVVLEPMPSCSEVPGCGEV